MPDDELVDPHEALENLSDDEQAAGAFLGVAIDPDDDEDNGSQWGTIDDPAMTDDDFAELGGEA